LEFLFYFILGAMFIQFFQPLIESILGLIMTWIEVVKAKISVKIAQYNTQIHETQGTEKRVAGFVCEEDDND
jgi:hypothetical protein